MLYQPLHTGTGPRSGQNCSRFWCKLWPVGTPMPSMALWEFCPVNGFTPAKLHLHVLFSIKYYCLRFVIKIIDCLLFVNWRFRILKPSVKFKSFSYFILLKLYLSFDCPSFLTEFTQDVTDTQMGHVAPVILPEMYKIFLHADVSFINSLKGKFFWGKERDICKHLWVKHCK